MDPISWSGSDPAQGHDTMNKLHRQLAKMKTSDPDVRSPTQVDVTTENSTFLAQVTRSNPGRYAVSESSRPNHQAIRHALRTESPAIFAHMAPLLEYARYMFDVARAVITVFRKDTLELYAGHEASRRKHDVYVGRVLLADIFRIPPYLPATGRYQIVR